MELLEYSRRPTDKLKAVETNLAKLEEVSYNVQVRKSEQVVSSMSIDPTEYAFLDEPRRLDDY